MKATPYESAELSAIFSCRPYSVINTHRIMIGLGWFESQEQFAIKNGLAEEMLP